MISMRFPKSISTLIQSRTSMQIFKVVTSTVSDDHIRKAASDYFTPRRILSRHFTVILVAVSSVESELFASEAELIPRPHRFGSLKINFE